MRRRFIGDRRFYGRMFAVLLPIVIQNFITNFVSLLDNIMVGQVGTVQMSGVAIVNQLLFIFNLCIFGGMSGAGIFTAQFCGSGDHEGIRHTFRYKIVLGILLSVLGGVLLFLFRGELISLFLQGDGDPAAAAASLAFGCDYLRIMLLGLLPFALTNAYSSTLRENGQTVVPMVAGIGAVTVNLVLNYVLIFGHLGAPTLGTDGAAIATVISRYVELAVVALYTHLHGREFPFIKGAFGSLYIPKRLLCSLILKGIPLLLSETLWSVGMTTLTQSYSIRGLDVVAALNIANTVINLSGVVYIAMGSTVGIIVGQLLGTGACEEEVRDTDRKLIFAAILSSIVFGGLLASVSAVFPRIYNTTDAVRGIATGLILISAAIMPFNSFTHCIYFTLRSGGCTGITFLYDNCYMWGVVVTTAFFLSRFSPLTIIPLYAICQSLDILKGALGILFLKSNMWIKRLAVPTDE